MTYSVVSGPGSVSQGQLTAQQAGAIVIQVDQAGNSTVLPAASVQFSVTALFPTTTVLSSSVSSADFGAAITLNAAVSYSFPVTVGTVSFYAGATLLGTSPVGNNGIATLTIATLPAGTDSLTASYSGTAQFTSSTSASISVTALFPTTTVLSSSVSSADFGTSITLNAAVSDSSQVTVGTVSFYAGPALVGTSPVGNNGIATLTIATLPGGTDSLTASYSGSSQFASSTSAPIGIEIKLPDFRIAVLSPSLSVKHSHSVSTSLIVTPVNGFNQALALSCTGLPVGASCSFLAPVAQSNGTLMIPLTITTRSVTNQSSAYQLNRPIYASIPLAFVFWLRRRKGRSSRILQSGVALIVLAIAFAMLSACGAWFRPIAGTATITAHSQTGIVRTTELTLTIH